MSQTAEIQMCRQILFNILRGFSGLYLTEKKTGNVDREKGWLGLLQQGLSVFIHSAS